MGMIFLANAGVPMLLLQGPALALMLAPVIFIEASLCRRFLSLPTNKAFWGVAFANLISTFIGFPILWLILVVIQMAGLGGNKSYGMETLALKIYAVTVQAPWLIPYETDLYWMLPTAGLVLLVPTFFVSVYIERWFCRWYWKYEDRATLNKAFWKIHCASYSLLVGVGLCLLAYSLQHKW
ncbi:MAG: hypothetical protein B9S32_17145 [Verrucomicrobia bacterium Tous-C9LFEB]|nr:MAG: hypothetical protein B9S32_17145 [Verrucomicrobia bacterium Tous-C9LFEB]